MPASDETTARVLEVVRREYAATGRSPAIRDLAEELDLSLSTVHAAIVKLRKEGLVSRNPGGLSGFNIPRRTE